MEKRNVKVLACILALDKSEDDEMIYRFVTGVDGDNKVHLLGGYLEKGKGASECVMDYIKNETGLDIMKAGEDQAILGFNSYTNTEPTLNPDEDVVMVFIIKTQLRYLRSLQKMGQIKTITNNKGDEVWTIKYLNPEKAKDIYKNNDWKEEWEKALLIGEIKDMLGEDYFESFDEEEETEE